MLLLVGLGNPGPRYAGHRHNVGFMAVDEIVRRRVFSPWRARFNGEVAEGHLGGERVIALKPMTFMNESSKAVGEAVRFLKVPLDRRRRLPRRARHRARAGAHEEGRRRRRPQRPARHRRPCRQGLSPGADRHRPSRPQGPGAALGAARLRAGRARSEGRLGAEAAERAGRGIGAADRRRRQGRREVHEPGGAVSRRLPIFRPG